MSLFKIESSYLKIKIFKLNIVYHVATSLFYFLFSHTLFQLCLSVDRFSASPSIFTIKLKITTTASLFIQYLTASHVVYFHCLLLLNINLNM